MRAGGVAVIDIGSANFGSVTRAFSSLGRVVRIAQEPSDIASAGLVVLPGVGHAGQAMRRLESGWVREGLEARHAEERPILGICLGAQVMCEWLEEAGAPGLGWMGGSVTRLTGAESQHTGWERLELPALRAAGLARGITRNATFYFNHTFRLPDDPVDAAVDSMGSPVIRALFKQDHLVGAQFHPEKSQASGRLLLRNLLEDHYVL